MPERIGGCNTRINITAAVIAAWCAAAFAVDDSASMPDDVVGGWTVFTDKQCIRCHAVWNVGGRVGPDLGRSGQEPLSSSDLAGTMWNHIPRMRSHMLQQRIAYPELSLKETGDLFSFLYFVRHLDEPGNASEGRRVVREKGCVHCHFTEERAEGQAALDLRRWESYANPIVWAQKMWEHAPRMEKAMREAGLSWPQLADADLRNIIAYVRSLGGQEVKTYLHPGSAQRGSELFSSHKCKSCHVRGGSGGDLSAIDLPRGVAALASRMWNHSPEMSEVMADQGIQRDTLEPQEMADIVAYIVSLAHEDRAIDATSGRQIFVKNRCAECHREEAQASSNAPAVEALSTALTPVRFAHALWRHGATMLDMMTDAGQVWPRFQAGEVANLIAYLESVGSVAVRDAPKSVGSPASEAPRQGVPEPGAASLRIELGASCVADSCHPSAVAGREVHAPAAQGECESCHRIVNADRHEFVLVRATSDLCYDCHDEPAETMHAHGPVSVTLCTACHDPHSSENAYGPDFTGEELCYADMIGMTTALATLVGDKPSPDGGARDPRSGPVRVAALVGTGDITATGPYLAPDVPSPDVNPDAGRVTPGRADLSSAGIAGNCTSSDCHVAIVSNAYVHPPTAQKQCEACHSLLDAPTHQFELAAKEPELCFQCHDWDSQKGEFVHGPLGLGLCSPCHDPHSAPHEALLPATGSQLCFTCHSEMEAHLQNAPVQHEAITDSEKGCLSCHDPHRSEYKFHLRQDVPDLCYSCHPETRETIEAAVVPHEPVVGAGQCGNCHDPHAGSEENLLSDTEINLCLGCHDRPMDTLSGPIIDMKSWIADNPERHGPIREGICTSCHLPHGSNEFRILAHSFPREFYRPFSIDTYDLCFQCHEETIVLDERTTTLTAFRNGDKNLHFIHVNQEKGRTCRACHEIHAGTRPKRMKEFVPYGTWKYPVNFEATPNGGRCAPGCHVPRAYSRIQEIR